MQLLIGITAVCAILIISEVLLRIWGYKPWDGHNGNKSCSGGNHNYLPDPIVGINYKFGMHQINGEGEAFNATHDSEALRITQPTNGVEHPKDEIWLFGCSYTHGWSFNDDETYPWLLQEKLPQYRIINFGRIGYSTIQSLCQFRKVLQIKKKPKYVVVGYCDVHDHRNTFTRSWKKTFEPSTIESHYANFPRGRVDNDGNLVIMETNRLYKPFPLMRNSALIHYFEIKYNSFQEWLSQSHKVSRAAMEEFLKTCEEEGIKLIICGMVDSSPTMHMLVYCKREGISILDMGVDIADPININDATGTFPSVVTNRYYASKLGAFIINYDIKALKKKNKRSRMKNKKVKVHA